MSMKVPAIVDEVKKALSQDMAVVIGLQTTGEVCSLCVHSCAHFYYICYLRTLFSDNVYKCYPFSNSKL